MCGIIVYRESGKISGTLWIPRLMNNFYGRKEDGWTPIRISAAGLTPTPQSRVDWSPDPLDPDDPDLQSEWLPVHLMLIRHPVNIWAKFVGFR